MRLPRVLLLIPNLGHGGAQRVFYDHAVAFSSFALVEEAVYDKNQDYRIYDSRLQLHDLKSISSDMPRNPFLRFLQRARHLRHLVSKHDFDVVVSHMDGANWVNVVSLNQARKILVVHGTILHDQNVTGFMQWLRCQVIFPWLYNRANCTVAVSEGIAHELRTVGKVRNVVTIPNFFNIKDIEEQAAKPLPLEQQSLFEHFPTLVSSGRLADQKKQFVLLSLLKKLRLQGSTAKLIVLGDGERREALLSQARSLDLSMWHPWQPDLAWSDTYDVYFMGYVSNPYQYLSRCTVFLFPSGWEGFPLALCEAMICGCPVVSTDCPTGPREILAPGPGTTLGHYDLAEPEWVENGVLMPMSSTEADIESWCSVVNRLLADKELRQRYASAARASMQSLDKAVIVERWKRLLERTLDER